MVGRDHLLTGAMAGLALGLAMARGAVPGYDPAFPGIVCVSAAAASLLPDIDTENSVASRALRVRLPFRHRTLTHAVWIPAALAMLSVAAGTGAFAQVLLGLAFGWAFHVAMDAMSKGGVCLLWPITRYGDECGRTRYHVAPYHKWSLRIYRTGSAEPSEILFTAVVCTLLVLAIILLW